jgi:hypothetical protein
MAQEDRLHLLDEALARAVPESRAWARRAWPETEAIPTEYSIDVPSPLRAEAQHLTILLRHDGDIQVEYHIAGERGSPFEALFIIDDQATDAIDEVARFVAELLSEKAILAYAKGFWRGGRRFLAPSVLTESARRELLWTTSWRGTYDWRP